ncbi:hypothetical protein BDV33DRAFT_172273 [Aspergillus novoparasiticus]|uniref:Uncharacterized protein n=1 Tax=Aspergillus novoparasiticus TaxID=986946 RepID=A0A5N6EUN0_9EURO|nr:hypothetical protein BDV33DRAFT_172273 [Aspergillus novoparasiticus]
MGSTVITLAPISSLSVLFSDSEGFRKRKFELARYQSFKPNIQSMLKNIMHPLRDVLCALGQRKGRGAIIAKVRKRKHGIENSAFSSPCFLFPLSLQ